MPRERGQRLERLGHRLGVLACEGEHEGGVEREREQHGEPVVRTSAAAEIGGDLRGCHVGLGKQHAVAPDPRGGLAHPGEQLEVLGRGRLVGADLLDDERRRVHPEARDAEAQPERHHLEDLRLHRRVGPVEVGLEVVEAVEVPAFGGLRPAPGLLLLAGKHHALMAVGRLGVGPHVEVAVARFRVAARGPEPRVLVAGVVDDEVDDHPHAAGVGLAQQPREVAQGPDPWVDREEVGDVVAGVAVRGGMDRVEPQAGDAEPGQVVQPADQPAQVAVAVAVGVLKRSDVEAVDGGLAVPAISHGATLP